jgi:hypothetical protein
MATAKNTAASKKDAAPKKFYFTIKDGEKTYKYLLKGKIYIFKGDKFSAEEASKNAKLCAALVSSSSPSVELV